MRTPLRGILPLLCVGLLAVPASGQASFEGVVESVNGTTDELGSPQKYVMTVSVKGVMVRVDIPAYGAEPAMTMIYRPDRKCVWILNEKESSYFEMRQEAGGEGTAAYGAIKRTGKKKTILGYPCDQLIASSGDARTEFWGTKKLAALAKTIATALGSGGEEGGGMINDELSAMGYFPLIARTRVDGSVVEWSEVRKIGRRSLTQDLFEVPAGYKKQSVHELMQGEAP